MKKIYLNIFGSLFLLAFAAFIFSGCDKVDSPYAVVKPMNHDTTDTTTNVRKILLEDYTGHTCPNCPEGTLIGQALQASYSGQVIMVAVHAGFFARPLSAPFTADYRTTAGEAWNNEYGFASYPNGLVNRAMYGSSKIVSPDQWAAAIESIINNPPDASIKITASVDTSQRLLTVDVQSTFLNAMSGTYNLTVCILEDSIVSAQKNSVPEVGPTPIIEDYTYMDMLRGTLTDTWGEYVTSDPAAGSFFHNHYSYVIDDKVVIKHASLVAFISNADTKEVVQAEKKEIR